MLAQDPLNSHVTEGQVPFAFQALSAEGGKLAAQSQDPLGQFPGDLVGAGMGSPRARFESFQALGLKAPYPLAHGRHRRLEGAGRRFNPVLAGMGDQAQAISESIPHLTNHVEVGDGSRHRPGILSRPAAALLSPQQGGHLSAPRLTQTLQPHRGIRCTLPIPPQLSY